MRTRIAGLGVVILGLAVAGAVVLGTAAPAVAHSAIVASTPAEGEVLTELPDEFSVTANETLLNLGDQGTFALQIRDAEGRYYGDGCVSVVDATMSAAPAIGGSGEYVMLWRVISADGHPVNGEIAFTWEAPDGFEPAASHASAPVCGEDPDAGGAEPPAGPGVDSSAIAIGVGVGVALLGAAIVVAGVVVAARRRKPGRGPDAEDPPSGS